MDMTTLAFPCIVGMVFEALGLHGAMSAALGVSIAMMGAAGMVDARRMDHAWLPQFGWTTLGVSMVAITASSTLTDPAGFGYWLTGPHAIA